MEKRTLFAVFISILFLLVYDALVIAPQRRAEMVKRADVATMESVRDPDSVGIEIETSPKAPRVSVESAATLEHDTPASRQEQIPTEYYYLQTDKLDITFFNLGGTISSINMPDFGHKMPVTNILSILNFDDALFVQTSGGRGTVLQHQTNGLKIVKTFEYVDNYTINTKVVVRNTSNMSKLFEANFNAFDITADMNEDSRDNVLNEYSIKTPKKVIRKGNANKFTDKHNKSENIQVEWVGFRNRYFCTLIKPKFEVEGYSTESMTDTRLSINLDAGKQELSPGEEVVYEFLIYSGPQDLALLKNVNGNISEILVFSNWKIIDVVAKAIYYTMVFIHKFIPNWGICIILMCFIIYGVTYPLTFKSMMSMKKMQAVQPKMAALKEKHKSNPQKLNAEMMELYKKHKINPLGGCLPVILQMPVFFGLYQVLWRSVYLRGANFLWIEDLSQPDRLAILPFKIPFLGNELNILPIFMIFVMMAQQKITAKNMVATTPEQIAQQKIMSTILPFFIGIIFYKFASGLSLYFSVFYVLSTITQYKMSKMNKVEL